jgi:hypothetical protein
MSKVIKLFKRSNRDERALMAVRAMIVLCTAVAGVSMFSGFWALSPGGSVELVISGVFTLLVAAGLTFTLRNALSTTSLGERIAWMTGWLVCMILSVTLSFGMYFGLFSADTYAREQVRAEASSIVSPLMAFGGAYAQMAQATGDAAAYSSQVAARERAQGGTCPGSARPEDGPRTRLRNTDAATFQSYARYFGEREAAVARAIREAEAASRDYRAANHQAAMSAMRNAHQVASLAAGDPRIAEWEKTLRARIHAGRFPMRDPATSQTFSCPDGTLEGKLAGAASVRLPPVPDSVAEIEAPSHGQGVRRGLQLVMFSTAFVPRIDGLPVLAGITVDLLLLVFMIAEARLTEPRANARGPATAGGPAADMRQILSQRSTLGGIGDKLSAALDDEPWPWLALLQSWSWRSRGCLRIAVPSKAADHEDARKLRMILAALTRASGKAMKFQMSLPASKVPGRLGALCRRMIGDDIFVDIYKAPCTLLTELEQDWLLWALHDDAGDSAPAAPKAA